MQLREVTLGELVRIADLNRLSFSISINRDSEFEEGDMDEAKITVSDEDGKREHSTFFLLEKLNSATVQEAENKLGRAIDYAVSWNLIKKEEKAHDDAKEIQQG